MKRTLLMRTLCVLLLFALTLTYVPASLASEAAGQPATIGQIVDYLLTTAEGYADRLDRGALLQEVNAGEDAVATRLQALALISGAFGSLPEPKGNTKRIAPTEVSLDGVPAWALPALQNLKAGGVLAPSDLTGPEGNASQESAGAGTITLAEVETIVRRVWTLYATNLKDDFFAAVNKEYMDTSILPPGETTAGGLYDLRQLVTRQINDIIFEIVSGSGYASGSKEQKIQDLFTSAANMERRNQLGVEPLKKYLALIDAAKTVEELQGAQLQIQKELAMGNPLDFLLLSDPRDSKKWALYVQSPIMPSYTQEEYDDPENKLISATWTLNKKLLLLAGESEEDAERQAGATLALEKLLLPANPTAEEMSNPKPVTLSELQALLPALDVAAVVAASGYQMPDGFILTSPGLLKAYGELLTNENLALLKAEAKLSLLRASVFDLSQDFRDAYNEYNTAVSGAAADTRTPEELAADIVNSALGEYIDQLYVERHFSPEAKADVEKIIRSFIDNFKKRIAALDWMGDETKQRAIAKLDAMRFFVGYPDQWDDALDKLEISADDFFGNQTRSRHFGIAQFAARQFAPKEDGMALPASMVNAYYNQFSNSMAFPAGILQPPYYDVNASLEENLAYIGTIIAHEMTHAFDNNGAKYDENGNPIDWWAPEDYVKFQELCDRVAAFYDGWEAAAGVLIDRRQTLGENIADIGAMACLLDILRQQEEADYAAFFRAYASSWLKATTREQTEFMAQFDEHGPGNLRTNRVVVNFQEFYDAFDIGPGDGMYVAPEDRVSIW